MFSVSPAVSIVAPVYRNATTLAELHARLSAALEGVDWEVCFVDDACPAGSRKVLEELAVADYRVRVFSQPVNTGQARATLRGIRESRGAMVVVMDADLQDPPEAVPALIGELARRRAQIVFAGRRGVYQDRARTLTSRLFKITLSLLAGVPRDAGSFVAFTRAVAEKLETLDVPHPYLLAMLGSLHVPIESIPVERVPRPEGQSAYTESTRLAFAVRGLITAIRLQWLTPRTKPTPNTSANTSPDA